MVINRVFLQIPAQNQQNDYQIREKNPKSARIQTKFNYDQGGFSGGIRAKRLQIKLRGQMLHPIRGDKVINKAVVRETLSKNLPKNPILSFIHNAELLLMNILACRFIR